MAKTTSKKKYILAGNWKMHPQSFTEAKKLFAGIEKAAKTASKVEVIVAPPYVYLGRLAAENVSLAGQDIFHDGEGSFTGEVSGPMIEDAKAKYVIIGHSELRKLGDTNFDVSKKIKAALNTDLVPIVCFGEETRSDDGHHLDFLRTQIQQSFTGITKKDIEKMIIAYEPVWAIGAEQAMSANDVHEMSLFIKKVLREQWKGIKVESIPLLYGGSVDENNAGTIVQQGEVQGLLVGRQSLTVDSFKSIISTLNGL